MKATILKKICNLDQNSNPLSCVDIPVPVAGKRELLVKVSACGVCHTDLDEIEGRTSPKARISII